MNAAMRSGMPESEWLTSAVVRRTTPPAAPSSAPEEVREDKWPQYLVWGVLIACALLFSWIAWSLIRKNQN